MRKRLAEAITSVGLIGWCTANLLLAQGIYPEWMVHHNGSFNGDDYVKNMAIDDSGNIYVTGTAYNLNTGLDYLVIKYSPEGEVVWVRDYNGPGNSTDRAFDLVLDPQGNVIVGGESTPLGTFHFDFATLKYTADGELLWIRRYNGPGDSWDEINALTVDDSGNVYVTGNSYGASSLNDYVTIKYSSQGETLWVRRNNGELNDHDIPTFIALDKWRNVYVAGYSPGIGTKNDYLTVKYSYSGEKLWERRYNSSDSLDDLAWSVALDTGDNVYVTGSTGTIKYSQTGDSLWVNTELKGVFALADNFGQLIITGYGKTYKCSSQGEVLWSGFYGGNDLDLDNMGSVYVTGGAVDIQTTKYSSLGSVVWSATYNGQDDEIDQGIEVGIGKDENPIVSGVSWAMNEGYNWVVIKYSPCLALPGDVDESYAVTLIDVIYLVNHVFDKDRPPCLGGDLGNCWGSQPVCRLDINGSGNVNLGDIIHLVNHIFDKDRPPCLGINPGSCWAPPDNGPCCLSIP